MAIGTPTYLGAGNSSANNVQTVTYTLTAGQTVDVGDLLVAFCVYARTSGTISSAADSGTNAWSASTTQVDTSNATVGRSRMFASKITTALSQGSTVTLTMGEQNTSNKFFYLAKIPGAEAYDQQGTNTATSTNPTVTIGPFTRPNCIILIGMVSTVSTTLPGSYTHVWGTTEGATSSLDYRIVSDSSQVTPAYSAASGTWALSAMSFREGRRNRMTLLGVG